jgi:hypothetical protein
MAEATAVQTRFLLGIVAGASLILHHGAAQAAAAPAAPRPPTVSGVTVTAPKALGQEPKLRPKLEAFVRAYGASAPIGQLARWQQKVCPAVSGLSAQDDAAVAGRKSQQAELVWKMERSLRP